MAPVNRAIEVFLIDHILLYKESSRINTASLQNTSLWLLYSHLDLDQSNAQLLSQLFAGDGVPALNLWIFQHSFSFRGAARLWFGIAIVHAYSAGTLKNLANSCYKNHNSFVLFMFLFRKMLAHSWVLVYTACYDKKVEWMTSGCCLTPKGIRGTLQLYGCNRVIILYFSLSIIQHNKRARCIIVFGVLCYWFGETVVLMH